MYFDREKYVRLSEVFPNGIIGNGIFSQLDGMPWENDVNGSTLDIQYFGNHSGEKIISPLLSKIIGDNKTLDIVALSNVIKIIKAMFSTSWANLYKALTAEYNPLNNYDMKENGQDTEVSQESGSNTGTQENVLTYGKTENDTVTYGKQTVTKDEDNTTNTRKVSAFDSDAPETAEIITDDIERNKTETNSGNDKHDIKSGGSDTDTRTDNLAHSTSGSKTLTHELTRSGNIGVTSSQQLIESEIELRKKHFFDMVFRDVDSVLTIQIY